VSVTERFHGHRYLLEFDEFAFRFNPATFGDDAPGAARIIDLADPAHPRVVSNIRLAVNMPAAHQQADGDPSPMPSPNFNYSAHYCAIPREVDPEIAACSFINSGLRIFNIQDPLHPREVAYYVSPPKAAAAPGAPAADFAMSQPAFDPARREVWYTDATSGFYVLKLAPSAWPHSTKRYPGCGSAAARAPRESDLDAALLEPLTDAVGRIALPLGTRCEPQNLLRLVRKLVAPMRRVKDRYRRHQDGGIVDLYVDAFDRDRYPLLEVLDRRCRLIRILELGQKVAQAGVGAWRVADLDRAPGELKQRDRWRIGGHGPEPCPLGRISSAFAIAHQHGGAPLGPRGHELR
jgi:hypothetical protein